MENTILLIDAYAQIYRGFYALPPMSSSKGVYTNAVYAFSRFLLNLEKEFNPEYGAVVFDLGKCTSRIEILPDYKANRPPMPDELRSQVPLIREIVTAFGYPLLESEGIEADDLIAALAKQFTDYAVRIISSDKDIAQVIDGRVEMLIPKRKGGGFEKRGVDEVFAKFAVSPEQIVDYLALIGDASDNIPGIQGVGPKTAATLIDQCSSIQAMLDDPTLIEKEKWREKVTEAADILKKNIQLITLDTSLPDKSWEKDEIITRLTPDWNKIADLAKELELRSFLRDLEDYCEKHGNAIPHREEPAEDPDALPVIPDLDDLFADTAELQSKKELKSDKQKDSQDLFTPDLFD